MPDPEVIESMKTARKIDTYCKKFFVTKTATVCWTPGIIFFICFQAICFANCISARIEFLVFMALVHFFHNGYKFYIVL